MNLMMYLQLCFLTCFLKFSWPAHGFHRFVIRETAQLKKLYNGKTKLHLERLKKIDRVISLIL